MVLIMVREKSKLFETSKKLVSDHLFFVIIKKISNLTINMI